MVRTKNLWIIHLLGWILFISLPLTIMSREPGQDIQLVLLTSASFWLFFLLYFLLFYLNALVLIPRLFLKQKYVLFIGIFIGAFLAIYYFQPFENLIFEKFHTQEEPRELNERFPGPPPRPFGETGPPPPPRGHLKRARCRFCQPGFVCRDLGSCDGSQNFRAMAAFGKKGYSF
jgi:two-component system LytT family sensor kinase